MSWRSKEDIEFTGFLRDVCQVTGCTRLSRMYAHPWMTHYCNYKTRECSLPPHPKVSEGRWKKAFTNPFVNWGEYEEVPTLKDQLFCKIFKSLSYQNSQMDQPEDPFPVHLKYHGELCIYQVSAFLFGLSYHWL